MAACDEQKKRVVDILKVLVIGGTGLISTAIVNQLAARGDEVTVFNRNKTAPRIPDTVYRLIGDRHDPNAFEGQLQDKRFDAVIDMIAFVEEDIESDWRALGARSGHFIFCSTVCVYGGLLSRLPADEEEPRLPISNYGRNKVKCEDAVWRLFGENRVSATIMRPSTTYGEGGNVVHSLGWRTTFLDRLRRGLPVVVHGDGQALRVACHVEDVAAAFVNSLGNNRANGQSYNLTGEEPQTWNQHAEGAAAAFGKSAQIVHIPTDLLMRLAPDRAGISYEIFQYPSIYNNDKAKRDLDFRYTIPFRDGVQRTIRWLENNGRIESTESDPLDDRLISSWKSACDEMAKQVRAD